MSTKIEKCCRFIQTYREIEWTNITITICLTPFVLMVFLLVLIIVMIADDIGAIVSNSRECAFIGKEVIKDGGSAVDAAIATLICEGVALPNSAGIGGGFVALIYTSGRFNSIVATPTIPSGIRGIKKFNSSFNYGAISAGVPGELMGYWEMHQKYGVLPWRRLFEPSIKLCLRGVPMTRWFAHLIKHNALRLQSSESMKFLLPLRISSSYDEGTKVKYPAMANTLNKIANGGASIFYDGQLGDAFINDVQKNGGLLTKSDLRNYSVIWNNDVPQLGLKTLFKVVSTPLPTSGVIITLVLNVVKNLNIDKNPPLFWHKFVEAMKHGFGHSFNLGDMLNDPAAAEVIQETYEKLIDPDYAVKIRDLIRDDKTFDNYEYYGSKALYREEGGSANICVTAPNGDVVVATTGLGHQFGASFGSINTGIVVNNLLSRYVHIKMSKLKTVPSLRPVPGTHPFSVHSPTIVLLRRRGKPYYVVGASGGPLATTSIITSIIKYVILLANGSEAANPRYLHHRPFPNRIEYEEIDSSTFSFLKNVGHRLSQKIRTYSNFSALTCIGYRHIQTDAEYNLGRGGSKALISPNTSFHLLLIFIFTLLVIAILAFTLYELKKPEKMYPSFSSWI